MNEVIVVGGIGTIGVAALQILAQMGAEVRPATADEEQALTAIERLPVGHAVMPLHMIPVPELLTAYRTEPTRSRYNRNANRPYPNPYRK